jgi:hypothetical protein
VGDFAPIVARRHLVFNERAIDILKPHAKGFMEYYDAKTPGLPCACKTPSLRRDR